jgi:hypothetical protein
LSDKHRLQLFWAVTFEKSITLFWPLGGSADEISSFFTVVFLFKIALSASPKSFEVICDLGSSPLIRLRDGQLQRAVADRREMTSPIDCKISLNSYVSLNFSPVPNFADFLQQFFLRIGLVVLCN